MKIISLPAIQKLVDKMFENQRYFRSYFHPEKRLTPLEVVFNKVYGPVNDRFLPLIRLQTHYYRVTIT